MSSGARERKNDICEALVGDMSSLMSYRKEINLLDTDQEKKGGRRLRNNRGKEKEEEEGEDEVEKKRCGGRGEDGQERTVGER